MGDFNMHPVYFGGIDIVFDERGSQFLTMRKTQWVKDGNEPDEEKAKYEIRKYSINNEGEEVCGKGVSFLNPDGPDNMVSELVKNGFGDTSDMLRSLIMRDNFKDSVENLDADENASVGEREHFVDMKKILLSNVSNEEIEEAS